MTPLDALCPRPFHDCDDATRALILRQLADTMLYVALTEEAAADHLHLRKLDTPAGALALACDSEDRLADFFGSVVDYAGMPGRMLAAHLAAEEVGLLVNPGAPSEMLLDAGLLGWLVDALDQRPDTGTGAARLSPPAPEVIATLLTPLGNRLADMAGLAEAAYLVQAEWDDGRKSHLLLIEGALPEAEPAIAKAMAELVAFLPPLPGGLDVSFAPLTPPTGAPRIVIETPAPAPKPKREQGPPILR